MDFFEKLYSGEMQPVKEAVDMVSDTTEYKQLTHALSEESKAFYGVLNAEQEAAFEKYREKSERYELFIQAQIFKLGFLYGAELKKATAQPKPEQPE